MLVGGSFRRCVVAFGSLSIFYWIIAGFHLLFKLEVLVLALKVQHPRRWTVLLEASLKLGAQTVGRLLVLVLILIETLPELITGRVALGSLLLTGKGHFWIAQNRGEDEVAVSSTDGKLVVAMVVLVQIRER